MLQYSFYTLSPKTISLVTVWRWIISAGIPIYVDLISKKPDAGSTPYVVIQDQSWGKWPKPKYSHEIVVFDARQPTEFDPTHGAVGLCWPADHNISIAYYGYESDKDMGARIYHELLHSMGIDSDQMEDKDFSDFSYYLMNTDPSWLNVITRVHHPKYVDLLVMYYNWLVGKEFRDYLESYTVFDKAVMYWIRAKEVIKSIR